MFLIGIALGALGCQQNDAWAKRFAEREAGMHETLLAAQRSEARREPNLRRAAEFIEKDLERSRRNLERDLIALEDHFGRDVQRWHDRQPLYQQSIERILRGKPEQIEPTALRLFP